jgi:hypothetical protein
VIVAIASWQTVAPGATGVAMTPVTGDSPNVLTGQSEIAGRLLGAWTKAQAAGFSRFTFPYGHDNVRNIAFNNVANLPINVIPMGARQMMKGNDLMTVVQAGSATAGDVELFSALIAYPDIGGGSDMFISYEDYASQVEELVTVQDTVTATVAATYSGARAMNAVTTSLKAGRKYAILGGFAGIACQAITVRGVDLGNQRVAIPGNPTSQAETRDFFVRLAAWHDMPVIPCFNGTNAAGTFIECLTDENLTAVPFTLNLALLK